VPAGWGPKDTLDHYLGDGFTTSLTLARPTRPGPIVDAGIGLVNSGVARRDDVLLAQRDVSPPAVVFGRRAHVAPGSQLTTPKSDIVVRDSAEPRGGALGDGPRPR